MHYGIFKYQVLSFRMTNASATFQRWINQVLRDELIQEGVSYINGILITGKTTDEHRKKIQRILRKLAETEMKTKLSKCEFEKKKIIFLKHHISQYKIRPITDKLTVLRE